MSRYLFPIRLIFPLEFFFGIFFRNIHDIKSTVLVFDYYFKDFYNGTLGSHMIRKFHDFRLGSDKIRQNAAASLIQAAWRQNNYEIGFKIS